MRRYKIISAHKSVMKVFYFIPSNAQVIQIVLKNFAHFTLYKLTTFELELSYFMLCCIIVTTSINVLVRDVIMLFCKQWVTKHFN